MSGLWNAGSGLVSLIGKGLGSKQNYKEHAEQRWRSAGINMVGVDYCR